MMDRQMLLDHLAQAERHVAEGIEHIARQTALVDKLGRDGHDTTQAKALLTQFEEMQILHVTDRDRLLEQLKE